MTRIEQEKRTVRQIVEIYCHGKKHTPSKSSGTEKCLLHFFFIHSNVNTKDKIVRMLLFIAFLFNYLVVSLLENFYPTIYLPIGSLPIAQEIPKQQMYVEMAVAGIVSHSGNVGL